MNGQALLLHYFHDASPRTQANAGALHPGSTPAVGAFLIHTAHRIVSLTAVPGQSLLNNQKLSKQIH